MTPQKHPITAWRASSKLRFLLVMAEDPERVTIPKALIRKLWKERLLNMDVLIERLRNGKWEQVYNWPARKLIGGQLCQDCGKPYRDHHKSHLGGIDCP